MTTSGSLGHWKWAGSFSCSLQICLTFWEVYVAAAVELLIAYKSISVWTVVGTKWIKKGTVFVENAEVHFGLWFPQLQIQLKYQLWRDCDEWPKKMYAIDLKVAKCIV